MEDLSVQDEGDSATLTDECGVELAVGLEWEEISHLDGNPYAENIVRSIMETDMHDFYFDSNYKLNMDFSNTGSSTSSHISPPSFIYNAITRSLIYGTELTILADIPSDAPDADAVTESNTGVFSLSPAGAVTFEIDEEVPEAALAHLLCEAQSLACSVDGISTATEQNNTVDDLSALVESIPNGGIKHLLVLLLSSHSGQTIPLEPLQVLFEFNITPQLESLPDEVASVYSSNGTKVVSAGEIEKTDMEGLNPDTVHQKRSLLDVLTTFELSTAIDGYETLSNQCLSSIASELFSDIDSQHWGVTLGGLAAANFPPSTETQQQHLSSLATVCEFLSQSGVLTHSTVVPNQAKSHTRNSEVTEVDNLTGCKSVIYAMLYESKPLLTSDISIQTDYSITTIRESLRDLQEADVVTSESVSNGDLSVYSLPNSGNSVSSD